MFESNHRRLWLGGTVLIGAMLGLLIALPWFPVASSGKTVQLEFLRSEPDQALLFFGFPGCGEICPIAMERLHAIKSNGGFSVPIQVGLVNIAVDLPAFTVSEYAHSFDPEFAGYHLDRGKLRSLAPDLGLNLPATEGGLSTSFSHPDALFLLQHVEDESWRLKQIFSATRLTRQQLLKSL